MLNRENNDMLLRHAVLSPPDTQQQRDEETFVWKQNPS